MYKLNHNKKKIVMMNNDIIAIKSMLSQLLLYISIFLIKSTIVCHKEF